MSFRSSTKALLYQRLIVVFNAEHYCAVCVFVGEPKMVRVELKNESIVCQLLPSYLLPRNVALKYCSLWTRLVLQWMVSSSRFVTTLDSKVAHQDSTGPFNQREFGTRMNQEPGRYKRSKDLRHGDECW